MASTTATTIRNAGLAITASLILSSAVHAEGAVAVGQPDDVARFGYAIGLSGNYPTEAAARQRALQECKAGAAAPQSTRDLCTVVRTFRNGCAAASLDPEDGTPGAGWAIGPTRAEAEQAAIEACRQTAGPGREDQCVVSAVQCDGVE